MKKTLVALAALAATSAFAQSSVTMYGSFDLGYQTSDLKNIGGSTASDKQRTISGINSGASANGALTSNRIGFKGTEDLGGGMKASFNYELGFSGAAASNDNASAAALGAAAARESNLTAEGGFGAVKIGYGTTLTHGTIAGFRAISASNMAGDLAYSGDSNSSADYRIHTNAVRSNAVTYVTPTFSGFNAAVSVGDQSDKLDSAASTKEGSKNTAFQLNYTNGPLKLSAVSHKATANVKAVAADPNKYILLVAAAETDTKIDAISAQYTMGAVTVDALYATNKVTDALTAAQTSKNDVTQVGVKYVMGNTTLAAQYGTGSKEGANSTTDIGDRSGYQMAAIYSMSKRTNVYAAYGSQELKYKSGTNNGKTEEVSTMALGLRHSF